MFRKLVPLALTVALTTMTGSPALAGQLSRTVSYHGLDLTSTGGIRAFHRRVRKAAGYVCRLPAIGDSLLQRADPECRATAISEAGPQVLRAIQNAEARSGTQLASR